jgi:hypothetical protein
MKFKFLHGNLAAFEKWKLVLSLKKSDSFSMVEKDGKIYEFKMDVLLFLMVFFKPIQLSITKHQKV